MAKQHLVNMYMGYQEAVDALTDAIQESPRRAKVAQTIYRFSMGCIEVGRARMSDEAGHDERAKDQADRAMQDFINVMNRLERDT